VDYSLEDISPATIHRTTINRAARFIIGGDIRNHTNTHKHTQAHLHTNKYTVFQKKTSTHIIGYKLSNSCLILIIFDINIPHIIEHHKTA